MTELLARNLSQSVGYFEPNMKVGIISNYLFDRKKLFVLHKGEFWVLLLAERLPDVISPIKHLRQKYKITEEVVDFLSLHFLTFPAETSRN